MDSNSSDDLEAQATRLSKEEEATYEPLSLGRSKTRDGSRAPSHRAISRARSQNGYSCDDNPGDSDGYGSSSSTAEGSTGPERDPWEVSWDGGDKDPLCPRSFGLGTKWLIVTIVSVGSFCVTCASSIYTSTYAQMDAEFNTTRLISTIGLSSFVLGIAFGPAMLSPLSEFFGRRPIYIVSFVLYVVWTVPSAVATNIATMIVARFFAGFSGSAFLSVAGGTVSDLFTRDTLHWPMTVYSLAPFVGPSMGPLFGGFINYYADWRWTHYVLLIWGVAMLVAIVLFVPETYHPVILRNKARRLRKETGEERWLAPIEKSDKTLLGSVAYSLLRPFQLLIFEPMCLNLCIFSAILLGVLYLFFGAFPLVFVNNHGFNLWQVGLTFLGMLVGMVAAALTDPLWNRMRDDLIQRRHEKTGEPRASEPEYRLPPAIAGAVLVPIGLFWFGWTTFPWIHWIVPIIGSAVFGAGTLLVFTGIFTFLVDAYPLYAASALAANALVRCTFAAAFPLFGIQMYEKLGYPWATSVLAFLTVAMMPFPYIFFVYGKRIRRSSRFASD